MIKLFLNEKDGPVKLRDLSMIVKKTEEEIY